MCSWNHALVGEIDDHFPELSKSDLNVKNLSDWTINDKTIIELGYGEILWQNIDVLATDKSRYSLNI